MQNEKVIIIGGGPCGMSCAIELQKHGMNPLIIEKENIVNTIYNFPTHQMFFSSSEKLEIGDVPFITENQKPVRNQALAYYRAVAERKNLRVNTFEKVIEVKPENNGFLVRTSKNTHEICNYEADHVIIATGYYDQPNYLGIPGEELSKVMHYFKEPHPYFNKDVVVIGGKNSAVDATLELHKAGARVMVIYRGEEYSKSIKPWILPEFDSLVRKDLVQMHFQSQVTKITNNELYYTNNSETMRIKNDFVFAMTGYKPDLLFLENIGIEIDKMNGAPRYNENTFETNISGIYIAGVVAAGYNNNKIFIENGRFHGQAIAESITQKSKMIAE
ncbi:hypothetical protein CIL05_11680 [Virgibacillus profundi]|uniref:Uncharacterized protein n=1 Tax=Virgibacillus profundi TaxID=2024555 RepID=A0A2A2IDR8_9BACI|nr:YpdA family putative bacillithiol disulfide reductase [Virgibacillus profundi]PAV29518.1 hypothetical protein CIL05_11680 [Virgibacillus profundi]PXY53688.1 YpdA family putative bacillithiol disulfide reductase [Virgibacillus profundi]